MRKKRNPAALNIANDIIAAYKPESVEEMHEAIKDVFGPMTILNGEMENYLGYANNSKSEKTTENRWLLRKEAQNVAGLWLKYLLPRDRAAESMLISTKAMKLTEKTMCWNEYSRRRLSTIFMDSNSVRSKFPKSLTLSSKNKETGNFVLSNLFIRLFLLTACM